MYMYGGSTFFFYHLVHSIFDLQCCGYRESYWCSKYTLDQKILIKCICTAKIVQHLVEYCMKSTCVSTADVFQEGPGLQFFLN